MAASPAPGVPAQAVIGGGTDITLYDGLWDPRATSWLLEAVRDGRTVDDLRFVPEPEAELPRGLTGRVLGAEQSNTSVVWGDRTIFKLFRRVLPGLNPDLELHRALRAEGSTRVAALQGAVEGTVGGEPATLGMLQDFAAGSEDGWTRALRTVRAAVTGRGESDFTAEARLLGETVADRARGAGPRPGRRHTSTPASWPPAGASGWPPATRRCPSWARSSDGHPRRPRRRRGRRRSRCRCSACTATCISARRCAPTTAGWSSTSRASRRRRWPSAPVRTPRCGTWPGCSARSTTPPTTRCCPAPPERAPSSAAAEWAARTRDAFCDGYAAAAGHDPRADGALLQAFELDKAVYEAVYETRNRPSWAPIPLASIRRLVSGSDPRA